MVTRERERARESAREHTCTHVLAQCEPCPMRRRGSGERAGRKDTWRALWPAMQRSSEDRKSGRTAESQAQRAAADTARTRSPLRTLPQRLRLERAAYQWQQRRACPQPFAFGLGAACAEDCGSPPRRRVTRCPNSCTAQSQRDTHSQGHGSPASSRSPRSRAARAGRAPGPCLSSLASPLSQAGFSRNRARGCPASRHSRCTGRTRGRPSSFRRWGTRPAEAPRHASSSLPLVLPFPQSIKPGGFLPPLQEEGEGGHVEGRRHLRQPLQNSPHWRQVPLPFGSCPVSPRDGLCSRGAFLLFWPCFCLKRGRSSYHGARAHGRRDCRPMRTCAQMGIRGVAVHCCVPWHMPHRVSRRHGVAPRRGATPCHTNTAG